jgi:hypothetical protein
MFAPLLVFLALTEVFLPAATAANPPASCVQTYVIFHKGAPIGTETVVERVDKNGNIVTNSTHEMYISDGMEDKRLAFNTSMILAGETLAPIRYSSQYTSGEMGDFYDVTVKDGQISWVVNRGGHVSEASALFRQGVMILDYNVFHHYDYLIRRYDFKRGGRQTFTDFIPLAGGEVTLALTRLEDSNLSHGKNSIPVRNFRLEIVGIRTGLLACDRAGRLVRLWMQTQDLEVLRKDLVQD